ncbi:hypothetical protein DAMA08_025490 [Martiniozyma asiatica (nom. inval.)]|nr:hypothetical protein DAMA08_025490 [Martiniozyma asiatica]
MTASQKKPVALTQSLTPLQEKAILGIDLAKYSFKFKDENMDKQDSTFKVLSKLQSGDLDTLHSCYSKTVQNEFGYSITLVALFGRLELDPNSGPLVLKRLVDIELENLPLFSNMLAWNYLEKIIFNLSNTMFKQITSWDQLRESYYKSGANERSILFSIFLYWIGFELFKNNRKELKHVASNLCDYFNKYGSAIHFPKANVVNKDINPLANLLIYLFRNEKYSPLLDISKGIKQLIQVTYQNSKIMKLWCLSAIRKQNLNECKTTFKTYLNYMDDYKVKHKGSYHDLFDFVNLHLDVLNFAITDVRTREQYSELDTWFNQLNEVINENLISIVGDDPSIYSDTLKVFLSHYYDQMGQIYETLMPYSTLASIEKIKKLVVYCQESVKFIKNTGDVDPDIASYYHYRLAFYQHKLGENQSAKKTLSSALKISENSLHCVSLYAKLNTSSEKFLPGACKILSDMVDLVKEDIEKGDRELKLIEKDILLDMYLTTMYLSGMDPNEKKKKSEIKEKLTTRTIVIGDDSNNCAPCTPPIRESKNSLLRKITGGSQKPPRSYHHISTSNSVAINDRVIEKESEARIVHKTLLELSRVLQEVGYWEDSVAAVKNAQKFRPDSLLAQAAREARMGCLFTEMGDKRAFTSLGKAFDILSSHELKNNLEYLTAKAEAIVGLSQLCLRSDSFLDENDKLACKSRCCKYLNELLLTPEFFNDSHIWYTLAEISQEQEEAALLEAVDGWCGVKLLRPMKRL